MGTGKIIVWIIIILVFWGAYLHPISVQRSIDRCISSTMNICGKEKCYMDNMGFVGWYSNKKDYELCLLEEIVKKDV